MPTTCVRSKLAWLERNLSSYYEKVTDQFQRLDDASVNAATHIPWMNDLVVR